MPASLFYVPVIKIDGNSPKTFLVFTIAATAATVTHFSPHVKRYGHDVRKRGHHGCVVDVQAAVNWRHDKVLLQPNVQVWRKP